MAAPPRQLSTAGLHVLDVLAALSDAPALPVPRWWHWVLGLDHRGRLTLPAEGRQLAADGTVRAFSQAGAVILRLDGVGASAPVDRRGRVLLPGWLRVHLGAPGEAVFVAARGPMHPRWSSRRPPASTTSPTCSPGRGPDGPPSPAADVGKPRRLASRRRGLDEQELLETVEAVRTTSRDIELDLLLVRFHRPRAPGRAGVALPAPGDRRRIRGCSNPMSWST